MKHTASGHFAPSEELDPYDAEVFAYRNYVGAMHALCMVAHDAQNAAGLRAIMENAKAEWAATLRALDDA